MERTLVFLVCVALFYAASAYDGPYASYTEWYFSGCNATSNNYLSQVYLYPADGSCFTPTGGLASAGWSFRISIINSTSVNIIQYYDTSCENTWATEIYPIDACPKNGDSVISIFETMPSNQYWLDQGYVGYYGPWETVLVVDYYTSACQNGAWINTEILGWEECYTGSNFYCENNALHYDGCTDTTTCDSGCIEIYQPLSDTCTATANAPTYWNIYIDDPSSYYQATCVSASNDDSSSEPFYRKFWVIAVAIGCVAGLVAITVVVVVWKIHARRPYKELPDPTNTPAVLSLSVTPQVSAPEEPLYPRLDNPYTYN